MSHYQDISDRLLQDGYLLTALELHIELEERGKSIKTLKEYFENSSNFEKFTRQTNAKKTPSPAESISSITGSQFTDGSLFNMTRYSEDSHIHAEADKVAILEFELRRATQTINSLRNELTQQVKQYDPDKRRSMQKNRNESGAMDANEENGDTGQTDIGPPGDDIAKKHLLTATENHKNASDSFDSTSYDRLQQGNDIQHMEDDDEEESLELFGHEKRVLNYLVNEYLLQYGYRLTAITFSDENTDEDFEDWDSIGLNISKPPDLGRVYRDFNSRKSRYANNTSNPAMQNVAAKGETSDSGIQCEIITHGESELQNLILSNENEIEKLRLELHEATSNNEHLREICKKNETFETLENDLRAQITQLEEQRDSLRVALETDPNMKRNDNVAMNVEVCNDVSGVCKNSNLPNVSFSHTDMDVAEDSKPFHAFVRKKSLPILDTQNDICESTLCTAETFEEIIKLLANQLPQIVPHVLLARRGTILPLLLIAVEHHTSPEVRDNLLTILFNLTKKPDEEMRSVIVKGFVEIASRQGLRNNTTLVEAEILPQLWQQIEHKHLERRVLVAETCAWLLPHIPSDIRDSLVFSMLQQLILQDRENQVRKAAINSLGMLMLHLKDTDKLHNVITNILRPCLNDPSDDIVTTTQDGLLLCIAYRLAMADLNHLLQTTMNELNKNCQMLDSSENKATSQGLSPIAHPGSCPQSSSSNAFSDGLNVIILHKLKTCQYLLPFVISCVIKSAPFYEGAEEPSNQPSDISEEDTEDCEWSVTTDTILPLLFKTKQNATKSLEILQEYLDREWYESWFQLNWITDVLLVSMTQSASKIPVPVELCCDTSHNTKVVTPNMSEIHLDNVILQYIYFFRELTLSLGPNYAKKCVAQKFKELLPELLSNYLDVSNSNNQSETANTEINDLHSCALLPIYALGVLINFQTASRLTEIMGKWCIAYCLKGLSTHPIVFSIHYLLKIERPKNQSKNDEWYSEIRDALSEMAWNLLVHTSPKVRIFSGAILDMIASCDFTGTYDLVGTKILPGLVTLSSDSDYKVQKSAIPGLGSIIFAVSQGRRISKETCEKALFQLTSLLSEDTGEEGKLMTSSNVKNVHELYMEIAEAIFQIIYKYNQNSNLRRRDSNNSNDLHFLSIRDDVLIPKLNVINNKYIGKEFSDSKCLEMCNTLLNIYRTIIFEVKLPPQVFQASIVPSLAKLSKDFHRFGIVAQETACLQLIAQLETDYGGASNPGVIPFTTTIANSNHALSSSPSMDEMKNKMGKLKGFWKK